MGSYGAGKEALKSRMPMRMGVANPLTGLAMPMPNSGPSSRLASPMAPAVGEQHPRSVSPLPMNHRAGGAAGAGGVAPAGMHVAIPSSAQAAKALEQLKQQHYQHAAGSAGMTPAGVRPLNLQRGLNATAGLSPVHNDADDTFRHQTGRGGPAAAAAARQPQHLNNRPSMSPNGGDMDSSDDDSGARIMSGPTGHGMPTSQGGHHAAWDAPQNKRAAPLQRQQRDSAV